MRIRVRVPASSANLGCGFDIFGLALARYSTFIFDTDLSTGPPLQAFGANAPELQAEGCSVVYEALRAYEAAFGVRLPPFRLEVESGIPVGRGLGSSAAAIVGGLLGADALARGVSRGAALNPAEWSWLVRLGGEIEGHADNIAAALLGGLVVVVPATQEGQGPLVIPLAVPADLQAVVFLPDLALRTSAARAVLPEQVPLRDAVHNAARAALFVSIFAAPEARLQLLGEAMDDRLHQPYRAQLMPHLPALIEAAQAAGAYGAALSGAGPSIVALTSRTCAEAVRAALQGTAQSFGVAGEAEVLEIADSSAIAECEEQGRSSLKRKG